MGLHKCTYIIITRRLAYSPAVAALRLELINGDGPRAATYLYDQKRTETMPVPVVPVISAVPKPTSQGKRTYRDAFPGQEIRLDHAALSKRQKKNPSGDGTDKYDVHAICRRERRNRNAVMNALLSQYRQQHSSLQPVYSRSGSGSMHTFNPVRRSSIGTVRPSPFFLCFYLHSINWTLCHRHRLASNESQTRQVFSFLPFRDSFNPRLQSPLRLGSKSCQRRLGVRPGLIPPD